MTEANKSKSADVGEKEVQKKADAEIEKGFSGTEVDETPNENYSVAGVTSGKSTPESDAFKDGDKS